MGLHRIIQTRKDKNEAEEVQAELQKNLDALDNEIATGTLQLQEKLAAHASGNSSVDLEALNMQALQFQMKKFDATEKAITLIAQTTMAHPENKILHERLAPLAALYAGKMENVTKHNEALEGYWQRAAQSADREDQQKHYERIQRDPHGEASRPLIHSKNIRRDPRQQENIDGEGAEGHRMANSYG